MPALELAVLPVGVPQNDAGTRVGGAFFNAGYVTTTREVRIAAGEAVPARRRASRDET